MQSDMDKLNFLEDDVLGIKAKYIPLQSSSTQSGAVDSAGGRPTKDTGDLTDAGAATQEQQ
jgi:hypothetical protein